MKLKDFLRKIDEGRYIKIIQVKQYNSVDGAGSE